MWDWMWNPVDDSISSNKEQKQNEDIEFNPHMWSESSDEDNCADVDHQ